MPLVATFGDWLQTQRRRISAKSRLGEKLAYIHSHWEGLQTFLTDGRVEIDSNRVENMIRPLALNRKNALFARHDEGGVAWGRIASLIETCKINGIGPFAYLKATLEVLANGHPQSRIDDAPALELPTVKLKWPWGAGSAYRSGAFSHRKSRGKNRARSAPRDRLFNIRTIPSAREPELCKKPLRSPGFREVRMLFLQRQDSHTVASEAVHPDFFAHINRPGGSAELAKAIALGNLGDHASGGVQARDN